MPYLMQIEAVTLFKPCFVDIVIPSYHITSGHLLVKTVHHSFTGLLVTLTLPCHSYFNARLNRSAIPLAKAPLTYLLRCILSLLGRC